MSLDSERAQPSANDGEAVSHRVRGGRPPDAAGRRGAARAGSRQPNAARARDLETQLHGILTTGGGPAYPGPVHLQPLPSQVASISEAPAAKISS